MYNKHSQCLSKQEAQEWCDKKIPAQFWMRFISCNRTRRLLLVWFISAILLAYLTWYFSGNKQAMMIVNSLNQTKAFVSAEIAKLDAEQNKINAAIDLTHPTYEGSPDSELIRLQDHLNELRSELLILRQNYAVLQDELRIQPPTTYVDRTNFESRILAISTQDIGGLNKATLMCEIKGTHDAFARQATLLEDHKRNTQRNRKYVLDFLNVQCQSIDIWIHGLNSLTLEPQTKDMQKAQVRIDIDLQLLNNIKASYKGFSIKATSENPMTSDNVEEFKRDILKAFLSLTKVSTADQFFTRVQSDYDHCLQLVELQRSREERRKRIRHEKLVRRQKTLREEIRKSGISTIELMESTVCGYSLGTSEFPQNWEKLEKIRARIKNYMLVLLPLWKDVNRSSATSEHQLDKIEHAYLEHKGLLGNVHDLQGQTTSLVYRIKTLAQAARFSFDRRKGLLADAQQDAQWFVCTSDQGKAIYVSSKEKRMQYARDGVTPWIHPGHNHVVRWTYPGYICGVRYLPVQICSICGGFMQMAGRYRIKYLPTTTANWQLKKLKTEEMQHALARILNQRHPGLNLEPGEVKISWSTYRRNCDGERAMIQYGLTITVVQPNSMPLGLMGHADSTYTSSIAGFREAFQLTMKSVESHS